MKTHTAYIQVPCSEAPKNNGWYFTSLGDLTFFDGHWYSLLVTKRIPELEKHPDWWLEKREDVIVMTREEFSAQENVINNAIEAFDFVHSDCKPKEDSGYCDFFNLIMNAKESLKDLLL